MDRISLPVTFGGLCRDDSNDCQHQSDSSYESTIGRSRSDAIVQLFNIHLLRESVVTVSLLPLDASR
jgi:hypothetical protein